MKDFLNVKNSYYEGLLSNLFCSNDGFFAVFMHFFYQFNQFSVFHNEVSEDFHILYEKELLCCEKISKMIISLGGDNKYYSASRRFISGANIDYIKNLKNSIELDVELIENNIIEVKNCLNKIENSEIKKQLKEVLDIKNEELAQIKAILLSIYQK